MWKKNERFRNGKKFNKVDLKSDRIRKSLENKLKNYLLKSSLTLE
jgi:hypothetical protein